MIDVLVVAVVAALGALAVFGFVGTGLGRVPGRPERVAVGVVEAMLVGQALLAGYLLFTGSTPPERSTFLIYLVVSVCVLPIAWQFGTAEPTRWGGAVIAVGALATAVAVWRLDGLWTGAGG